MAPVGIFIIFSLCLATSSVVSDICPLHNHKDIIVFGDTCYLFVTSVRATYSAALSTCRIFGGALAAVENAETQKFLQEQLSGRFNYSQPAWIGLTRAQDNSTFALPDGSAPKFWNWASEEPGNVTSGNVCVAMDAGNNGAWITYSCGSYFSTAARLGHVCEFAPSAAVFPTSQISTGASLTQEISSINQMTTSMNVVNETTEHVTLTTTLSISPPNQSSPELTLIPASSTKQTSVSETLETETTAETSAPSPTTSTIVNTTRGPGAALAGSVCQQCGDLDSSTPCSDEELLMSTTSQCDDVTPYCMNDIFQNDGQAVFYKRCVNVEVCTQLWYVESSDRIQCVQYDPVVYTEDLVCHLCCYGDTCNGDAVPPAVTLYTPH